jgi:hypothetical protein
VPEHGAKWQKLNTLCGKFIYHKNFAVNTKLKEGNKEEKYAESYLTVIKDIG